MSTPAPAAQRPQASSTSATAPGVIPSSALLQGRNAVLIAHEGQHYRLQATRQGKLILTK